MNDQASLAPALHAALARALAQVNQVVLGKPREVRLAFVCLLAGGHLLIEDIPGVGKTTLAHALAATLGLSFQRIQFTSDLLPADIIGVGIYERDSKRFEFHRGPLFTQLLLADEINRAMPRTQSALLEAMAEGQATVDGVTHALEAPFFVVATQNPLDLTGTWPLPDSQLDRFMLRMSLGYPDRDAEQAMLAGIDRRSLVATLQPCLGAAQILELRRAATAVLASPALLEYVQALLAASRNHPAIRIGLSPRAGLALLAAARAHALVDGRGHCLPEDVQAVFAFVAAHRLVPNLNVAADRSRLAQGLLDTTPVR
ncbi:MAG: AAA family ATPase [Xanthomonadales bacterium]|nr:AAA family ATPase [Xanthomonadales bacterium]MCC6596817.1 AAA family ATPase [Rhodanobacteraceae bacterium]MDL1870214.1 AAA family ATPase [Gammaproteobacteria bacterium PRO6]